MCLLILILLVLISAITFATLTLAALAATFALAIVIIFAIATTLIFAIGLALSFLSVVFGVIVALPGWLHTNYKFSYTKEEYSGWFHALLLIIVIPLLGISTLLLSYRFAPVSYWALLGATLLVVGSSLQVACRVIKRNKSSHFHKETLDEIEERLVAFESESRETSDSNRRLIENQISALKAEIKNRKAINHLIEADGNRDLVELYGWAFVLFGGAATVLGIILG